MKSILRGKIWKLFGTFVCLDSFYCTLTQLISLSDGYM